MYDIQKDLSKSCGKKRKILKLDAVCICIYLFHPETERELFVSSEQYFYPNVNRREHFWTLQGFC